MPNNEPSRNSFIKLNIDATLKLKVEERGLQMDNQDKNILERKKPYLQKHKVSENPKQFSIAKKYNTCDKW